MTSAEIPPNSSEQWRAGGRPSLLCAGRSRSEHSAWATAWGVCRGDRGDAERRGLGSEALVPGWLRPGTEPRGEAAEQRGWRLQRELTQLQKPTLQLGKGVTKREGRTVGAVKGSRIKPQVLLNLSRRARVWGVCKPTRAQSKIWIA